MAIETLSPIDSPNLKGLTALITGGASGLGLSAATSFAEAGAFVTIADIQDGSSIAADLCSKGYEVQFIQCDIRNYDSQVKAFQDAVEFSPTKTLDAVAAFAGVDLQGPLVEHVATADVSLSPPPIPSLDPSDVNMKGTFYTATLALHYLRLPEQGIREHQVSKSLTIVTSLAGYIDATHSTAYAASKFGARGLFRAIRAQAQSHLNIRVNEIAPWVMRTPQSEAALQRMANHGILAEQGITIVPHDVLTRALARIVLDGGVSGLSYIPSPRYSDQPEGAVDLGDDIEGAYGGPKLAELMGLRKAAGDFLHA